MKLEAQPPLRQKQHQKRNKSKSSHVTRNKGLVKKKSTSRDSFPTKEVRKHVTLNDFLPQEYLGEISVNTVTCSVAEEEEKEEKSLVSEGLNHERDPERDAKILVLLGTVPSRMGWLQALSLPEEMRFALARAIENPTQYTSKENIEQGIYENHPERCAACSAALAFTDEDLMLGSKPHNRPLFVCGYIRKKKINRILVDGGSAVNIMPKSTMTKLGITESELTESRLMIQGFNLGGQRAIGMIRVDLTIGEMTATTIFHVIDSNTSYRLLLGRPWMHENGVVASTLHQCFKYYRNGERKVNADVKPFSEAESHFADAKFYASQGEPVDVMPTEIASTGKVMPKKLQSTVEEKPSRNALEPSHETVDEKKTKEIPSQRVKDMPQEFDKSMTLPVHKISDPKILTSPTPNSTKSPETPSSRKDGFDPVAYKLMENSGYDFSNPKPIGKLVEDKSYGLNKTQQKVQQQGERVWVKKVGLGFKESKPIVISGRRRSMQASKYIGVQEIEESVDENFEPVQKESVFDMIHLSSAKARSSVFDRLDGLVNSPTPSRVFNRLGDQSGKAHKSPKAKDVFTRLGKVTGKPTNFLSQKPKKEVFSRLGKKDVSLKPQWRPKNTA
ncbi:hypothetical protein SOVF_065000 [Spinacia oleracea]|nr:hypothetical protein SOVF_065000 [Spinacia oleracea]